MPGDGKLGYEGMELIWVIMKHDVEMVHKVPAKPVNPQMR